MEGGCWGLGDTRGGLRVLHGEAAEQSFHERNSQPKDQLTAFVSVVAQTGPEHCHTIKCQSTQSWPSKPRTSKSTTDRLHLALVYGIGKVAKGTAHVTLCWMRATIISPGILPPHMYNLLSSTHCMSVWPVQAYTLHTAQFPGENLTYQKEATTGCAQ